jgi:TetR/AcrR family transcriptional regulator, transcriptional repressor for nem operon
MVMATQGIAMPAAPARTRLLDAALGVIRAKGYAATSVEELCRAAGVTKGAFFHHFPSKEALAAAAALHWAEMTGALFAAAPYHAPSDPRERLLAYVAFRRALLEGTLPEITCYAGTMVQETYASHPAIRDACALAITGHAATLEPDIAALLAARGAPEGAPECATEGITAAGLALHIQAVIQGAFVLAKALDDPAVAAASLDHLRRYLACLFPPDPKEPSP